MKKISVVLFLVLALSLPQFVLAEESNTQKLNVIATKLYDISKTLNANNRYIYEKDTLDLTEAQRVAMLMGHISNSSTVCYLQHIMLFNAVCLNDNTRIALNYSESKLRDNVTRIKEVREYLTSETAVLILDQSVRKLEEALILLGKGTQLVAR